jgi:hypothetical protein
MDTDVDEVLNRLASRPDLTEREREYLVRRLGGPGPRTLARAGDEALRAGTYGPAAQAYRRAARLCPVERPLVWKARLMALCPPLIGRVLRRRQLGIEKAMGFTSDHVR